MKNQQYFIIYVWGWLYLKERMLVFLGLLFGDIGATLGDRRKIGGIFGISVGM